MNIYWADWAPEGGSLQHKMGREVRVSAHLHPRVEMKPPSSVKFIHFSRRALHFSTSLIRPELLTQ